MGAEEYKALLDRVIDAPTDADGNVLHVGDEVTSLGFDGVSDDESNFRRDQFRDLGLRAVKLARVVE